MFRIDNLRKVRSIIRERRGSVSAGEPNKLSRKISRIEKYAEVLV